MSKMPVAANDSIFLPGEKATHVYFMSEGRLAYIQRPVGQEESKKEHVDAGEHWIAEPVLWVRSWMHLGLMVALRECDILRVDPVPFAASIARSPAMLKMAREYAFKFVEWLNAKERALTQSDIAQGRRCLEDVPATLAGFVEQGLPEEARGTYPRFIGRGNAMSRGSLVGSP